MNSSENQNPGAGKSGKEDEIDVVTPLKEMGAGISAFFFRIFNFIGYLFSFVPLSFLLIRKFISASYKYKVILIVLCITGAIAGFAAHYFFKPYYKGTVIIASEGLKGLYFTKEVETLNVLAKEENYMELSRKLNIDTVVSKRIKGFEVNTAQFIDTKEQLLSEIEILQKSIESFDTLKSKENERLSQKDKLERLKFKLSKGEFNIDTDEKEFKVIFYVFDREILPQLSHNFLVYIDSNSFGKKRVEVQKNKLEQTKSIFQDQISNFDSLKKIVNQSYTEFYSQKEPQGSNNVMVGAPGQNSATPPDPFQAYQDEFQLKERKLIVENNLSLLKNVEIIQDLTIYRRPASMRKLYTTGIGGLAGLFLFLCFLGGKSLKYINKYLDEIELRKKED